MSRTAQRLTASLSLGLMLVVTTSCGDEEPEPTPKPSATSPSVSPAPSAPTLDEKQTADYNAAVQKYADYERFSDRVGKDPKDSQEIGRELATYAVYPETQNFIASTEELVAVGAHTEGQREVAWSSPVSVKNGRVVFKQCQTPGTWELVKGDNRAPQESNTVDEVTAVEIKDKWFIKKTVTGDEKC